MTPGVVVVTGASSGIGRSLARRLARDGRPVAVLARRGELLDTLVAEITSDGGRALALVCDVTKGPEVHEAMARIERELGPIETLVANAGGSDPTFVDDFRASHIEATVALNLMGVAHCVEAVLPGMLERGHGHLVAVSSLAAYRGLPTAAAYSAAKAALTNLMESLRVDLRPRGIAVTTLAPGFVRTKPNQNKRKRNKPLRWDLERATERMAGAIRSRKAYDAFPWPMVLLLGATRLMPRRLFDAIVAGRGRKPKPDRASKLGG